MKNILHKRGQLGNLEGIILSLIVIGILIGVAFLVLTKFKDQLDGTPEAVQGVNDTIEAFKQIPAFLPIVIIVAIVGILLGIVFGILPQQNRVV